MHYLIIDKFFFLLFIFLQYLLTYCHYIISTMLKFLLDFKKLIKMCSAHDCLGLVWFPHFPVLSRCTARLRSSPWSRLHLQTAGVWERPEIIISVISTSGPSIWGRGGYGGLHPVWGTIWAEPSGSWRKGRHFYLRIFKKLLVTICF